MNAQSDKSYKTSFELNEEEFRRIRDLINLHFDKLKTEKDVPSKEHEYLEVKFRNGGILDNTKFDEVFEFDNIDSEQIDSIEFNRTRHNLKHKASVNLKFNRTGYHPGISYKIRGERDWTFVLSSQLEERFEKLKTYDWSDIFSFSGMIGRTFYISFFILLIYLVLNSIFNPSLSSLQNKKLNYETKIFKVFEEHGFVGNKDIKEKTILDELKKFQNQDLNPIEALIKYEEIKLELKLIQSNHLNDLIQNQKILLKEKSINSFNEIIDLEKEKEKVILKIKQKEINDSIRTESNIWKYLKLFLIVIYILWFITILIYKKYQPINSFVWGQYKEIHTTNNAILKNYFLAVIVGIIVSVIGGIITNLI